MNTLDKLIEALEEKKFIAGNTQYREGWNICTDNCIDLITTLKEGFVLVPKEPTEEMQISGASASGIKTTVINKLWTVNKIYRAMLSSSEGAE